MHTLLDMKDGRIYRPKRRTVDGGLTAANFISCVRYDSVPRYDSVTITNGNGGGGHGSKAGTARGSIDCWSKVNNISEEAVSVEDKAVVVATTVKVTLEPTVVQSNGGRVFECVEEAEGDEEDEEERERRESDGYASEASFDGHRDYLTTTERVICGTTGTVRGMRNRVRAGIATFIHHSFLNEANQKDYARSERGRVVVYTTTNGIVRRTFQRCLRVNTILATLLVDFEERNVFIRKTYLKELNQRMSNVINSNEESHRHVHRLHHPPSKQSTSAAADDDDGRRTTTRRRSLSYGEKSNNDDGVEDDDDVGLDLVPQVFVDGRHLGGAARVEALNEIGILKRILKPYQRLDANRVCEMCGNYRLLLCNACNGSKKSFRCNHFSEDGRQAPLRCTNCDENGLVTCHSCHNRPNNTCSQQLNKNGFQLEKATGK